jgi:capsid protein
MTPEWEWVDPQSEQAAAKDAIESFMSDYQTELGARGRSWKAVMYQRAKENALKKKLGLLTPQEQQLAISAAQSASATHPEAQAVVSEVANAL